MQGCSSGCGWPGTFRGWFRCTPLTAAGAGTSTRWRRPVSDRTRAIFFGNPSFPSGWVLNNEEWAAVQRICIERQIRFLYWSAMEAIVFGGRKVVVPAALEGMRDLTVTLGRVACEKRMIGWRIGWIVASEAVTPQLGMVHIYNGLVASGFNQLGAIAALRADDHAAGVAER